MVVSLHDRLYIILGPIDGPWPALVVGLGGFEKKEIVFDVIVGAWERSVCWHGSIFPLAGVGDLRAPVWKPWTTTKRERALSCPDR